MDDVSPPTVTVDPPIFPGRFGGPGAHGARRGGTLIPDVEAVTRAGMAPPEILPRPRSEVPTRE